MMMTAQDDTRCQHQTVRRRVVAAAAALFRQRGYAAVGMDEIAVAAGVSWHQCRQLFPSKESIASAIYAEHVHTLAMFMDQQASGQIADCFHAALRQAVAAMAVDRAALAALFGAALVEGADLQLMGGPQAERLVSAYHRLVLSSQDALREPKALELGISLYMVQMLVLLFWLYDRSPGQASTWKLLRFAHELFRLARPLFFMPLIPRSLSKLAWIVMPELLRDSIGAAAQEDPRDSQQQDLDVHRD